MDLMIGENKIEVGTKFKIKGESFIYTITGMDNLYIHITFEDDNYLIKSDKISKSAMVSYSRDERLIFLSFATANEEDLTEFHPEHHTIIELTNGKLFMVLTGSGSGGQYTRWWWRSMRRNGTTVPEYWKFGPPESGVLELNSYHILLKYSK